MADEYKINHISDILKVPEDKFDAFLVDLRIWADMARPMHAALDAAGVDPLDYRHSFEWIDDGGHEFKGVSFTVHPDREAMNEA